MRHVVLHSIDSRVFLIIVIIIIIIIIIIIVIIIIIIIIKPGFHMMSRSSPWP